MQLLPQVSDRELRKLNDKQRRLQETAARNKADALRDDDNVFDVSYESQGGAGDAGDTVSATDIKVLRPWRSQVIGSDGCKQDPQPFLMVSW